MAAGDSYVTVYRGFQAATLDLIESMLAAEGLAPRRLGRANAALLGAGDYSVEQLIDVPDQHAERAKELISTFERQADDAQLADLEQEALRVPLQKTEGEPPNTRPLIGMLLVAAVIVALFLLANRLG